MIQKNNVKEIDKLRNELGLCEPPLLRKLFIEQLKLYSKLCFGRNYVCIDKIKSILPFKNLFRQIKCLKESQLHASKDQNKSEQALFVEDQYMVQAYEQLMSLLDNVYLDRQPQIQKIHPLSVFQINLEQVQVSQS